MRCSLVALLILALLAGGTYAVINYGIPAWNYYQAGQLLEGNQFDEAKVRFLSFGEWRDSADLAREADYRKAQQLMQNGNATAIKNAEEIYDALGAYCDSAQQRQAARYRRAGLML